MISPAEINHNIRTVLIAPVTSTLKSYPSKVICNVQKRKGTIMPEQIRTDKRRLIKKIAQLSIKEIKEVKLKIKDAVD